MLRQRRLIFIGKMLAAFPAESSNHLAVIQESALGLGKRLLGQAGNVAQEDQEEFGAILATITEHIKILTQKNLYLDRFARRIGNASFTPDPAEIVTEIVSFSSRAARLRKIAITTAMPEPLPGVSPDPGLVYFLAAIILNDMLERVAGGGQILIRARPTGKTVLIETEGYPLPEDSVPAIDEEKRHWCLCRQVATRFGGRLEAGANGNNKWRTSLFLPMKRTGTT